MFVVLIPMSKIQARAMSDILYYDPHQLRITVDPPAIGRPGTKTSILMMIYEAVNVYYYKYTIEGMNIVLVNLLVFVILSLMFGMIPAMRDSVSPITIFIMASLSVIPLAYYIGMAIANISAQSNFAVGAILNATFGSIVEIILYFFALKQGLGEMVKAALTGTLLATMLFIPGICMIIGGLKYREQTFNFRSAGISSSLLFVSIAGAYAPSLYQKAYGGHQMSCIGCYGMNETEEVRVGNLGQGMALNCSRCYYDQVHEFQRIEDDPTYEDHTRSLVWFCTIVLPITYVVGLIFTLRTHAHIYDLEDEEDDMGGHADHTGAGPIWSQFKSVTILCVSTVLLAFCAELVVHNVEPFIKKYGIKEEAIGLIMLSLLPDTAEIANGIKFSLGNNIALSIEIGSSKAVQVCLIQIPALVFVSEVFLSGEQR